MVRLKTLLLFLLIFQQTRSEEKSPGCPSSCFCAQTSVNCANKKLLFFPADLPYQTETLNLSGNYIENLKLGNAEEFSVAPENLTVIDLSKASLTLFKSNFFSKHFSQVHSLNRSVKILLLNSNKLNTIPLFESIAHLRHISLAFNQISEIEDVNLNDYYPHLEFLDLSKNLIRHLNRHFLNSFSSKPHSLQVLILSDNKIETIELEAFSLFPVLRIIRLSGNSLTHLHKNQFGSLPNLKSLDLSFNKLTQLESLTFSKLNSLQVLKLRKNNIHSLDDGSFFGLANLQKLNLDHNNITSVSNAWTFGLDSLTEFTLRYNQISQIEFDAWKPIPKLLELNLAYNHLDAIDSDDLNQLARLSVLKLMNNRISSIDETAFRQVYSLENLDLSNNEISWTIESSNGFFFPLSTLKRLRLDNNRIQMIVKQTFSGLDKLSMLNLTSNPISSIQDGSFDQFRSLKEFHLEFVDLICDCSLKWFYNWLKETDARRNSARSIKCRHPKELYFKTRTGFLTASLNDFTCQEFLKPYLLDDFSSFEKPVSAIKNENLTFYCKAASSSSDPVKFNWFKNKRTLTKSNRADFKQLSKRESENVTYFTNVFSLQNVQDDDEGEYLCMASNKFGTVYSEKFQVNVHVIPYFVKEPHNVTVKVGNTARLECAAKGQPTPIISWKKDGGDNFPAAMERRMHVMPADDVFFIVEVKKSDLGIYSCTATNDAGFVIATTHLNVYEEPSFVRKTTDKQVFIGTTIELECFAAGLLLPTIVWYKDGVELYPTERHFFTAYDQLLFILKVAPEDKGVYSCKLSNQYGTAQNSFVLQVLAQIKDTKGFSPWQIFINFLYNRSELIIGVISFCLTSFVWVFVICCCLKRRNKNSIEAQIRSNINQSDTNSINDGLDESQQLESPNRLPCVTGHRKATMIGSNSLSSSEKDTGIDESYKSYESDGEEMCIYDPYNWRLNQQVMHRSLPRSQSGKPSSSSGACSYGLSLPRRQQYLNIAPNTARLLPKNQRIKTQNMRHESMKMNRFIYSAPQPPVAKAALTTFETYSPYATTDMSEV